MKLLDGVGKGVSILGYKVMDLLGKKSGELHEHFASDKYLLQQEEITRLQKEVASMIKYPPTPLGVPVLTEHDILFAYRGIIKETFLAAGMIEGHEDFSTPCFMNTYMPAIRHVVQYYHLLPASEFHHHNEVGGLLRHSLEVALMTLRMCKAKTPDPIGFQDVEKLRLPRWRFAAWLSGLLHDAGKIISDMRVHGKEVPSQWNPQIESIYDFADRHRIERYTVSWNPHRANHYHEKLSALLMDKILSPMAKRWLYESSDNLSGPIIDALQSYTRKNGFIEEAMRKADAKSSERDRRTQYHHLMGDRKSGLGHAFISSLRELKKNKWNKVNEYGARIFVIDEEVYLDYRDGIMEVIQHINKDATNAGENARIINSYGKVASIMEELGIIEPMHEESDFARLTYKDAKGNPRQTDIVRVSYPNLVFEDTIVPPNLTDCEIVLSNIGETLTVAPNGRVVYDEPKKNPYQTIYNLDPEEGSQVNRNAARSLNVTGKPKTKDELLAANQSVANNAGSVAAGSTMGSGAQPSPHQPSTVAQTPNAPKGNTNKTGAKPKAAASTKKPAGSKPKSATPANKPAAKPSNNTKKTSQSKPKTSRPSIKFENEDNGGWDGMNISPDNQRSSEPTMPVDENCWAGININANPDKPQSKTDTSPKGQIAFNNMDDGQVSPGSVGDETHSASDNSLSENDNGSVALGKSSAGGVDTSSPVPKFKPKKPVNQAKSNTHVNAEHRATDRLRSVKTDELITLCYVIAYGLSEIHADNDSLIEVQQRPSLYVNKHWLGMVLTAIESNFDDTTYLDKLSESYKPKTTLGLDTDDYITISKEMYLAVAELLDIDGKLLIEQARYIYNLGRKGRMANPDFFHGKLKVTAQHEMLILKSKLAKELSLDNDGVINV
ncbi:TraI domain-containing protein [Vibrio sp. SCSIO 43140]|uniref:MobH family relaxase n=1 Tax=Vibrio sp. SCSIO 43140 TaxID=2819100 RepID=UPI002075F29F|nr:MobH family relaxase [Vibrio sp. SCSIO 43140]USD58927.1 TraI domain-containing protein [Vibrio sp. SCSIO 43140]